MDRSVLCCTICFVFFWNLSFSDYVYLYVERA